MNVDTGLVDGDWNRLRDILRLLAQPPQSSYSDGGERQSLDFISFVFKRAATIPATPEGDGVPSGWFDSPPAAGGNPLWMSKSYQRHDGTLIGSWDSPVDMSGTGGIIRQYSTDTSSWHTTYASGDIYMRQKVLGGAYGDSILIVGEGSSGIVKEHHIVADSITATKINVVGLNGISGRIVVADATDANIVTGGINAGATTLIAAGKIVVSDIDALALTNAPAEAGADVTVAQLAGKGVNIANSERTIFTQGTPLSAAANGAAVMSNAQTKVSTYSIEMTATAADNYLYLGTSLTDYNIPLSPNKKWIISAWVRSSVNGSEKIELHVRASNALHYATKLDIATANTWERVSCVADLSANASESATIRIDNEGGNGAVMYVDGVMLEEQIGNNTTPSPHAFPAGRISIDYIPDGTNYMRAPVTWQVSGQTTIDGGQIYTDTITALSIVAQTITYDELRQTPGSEAVDTGAMRDSATKIFVSAITAGPIAEPELHATWTEVEDATITSIGTIVEIAVCCTVADIGAVERNTEARIRVLRGTTVIYTGELVPVPNLGNVLFSKVLTDIPGVGAETYNLEVWAEQAGGAFAMQCSNMSVILKEDRGK